jgi:hypothetical protein
MLPDKSLFTFYSVIYLLFWSNVIHLSANINKNYVKGEEIERLLPGYYS